jgi:PAS domain S-box-containing protein
VEGLFQSTNEGRYLSANPALARIYGYDSPEELMSTITDIERQLYVDAQRRAEFVRCMREMDSVHQFESQVYRKDRSIIWISESARAVRDAEGRLLYFEGVVEEISRRKHAEEALLETNAQLEAAVQGLQIAQAQTIQQERLRLVGQMASGIAHDFNNLLSVILGYTEMLSHRQLDLPTQRGVEEIRHAADRAVALTRRILAAGREQVISRRVMDVNAAVRSLYPMLRRVIRADIELVVDLQPHPAQVTADPVQIERALMNLVLNARDALPNGGRVVISTQSLLRGAAGCETSYVALQVADNGCGMDAETRAHVFEPFFTTKPAGEGTGLGLASVDGMARQSGGLVELYSEVGQGTRVCVLLPETAVPAGEPSPPDEKETPPLATGSETVLLVEDEPRLRSLLYEVLSRSGYQVYEAANGLDAVRLAADSSMHLDLLLTDLVMPGLGGLELALRLQAQRPGLRVLFMSGYSAEAPSINTGKLGENFLQKPFEPSTLTTRVREVLDGREALART